MDPTGNRDKYNYDSFHDPPPRFPSSSFSEIPHQTPLDFRTQLPTARSASEPGRQFSGRQPQSHATMNGVPVQNYSHLYNNNWDYPTSPPVKAKSDYGEPGAGVQSVHDTTRSRLDDDHHARLQRPAPGRFDDKQAGIREWERRRVTKYHRRDSSSDSHPSDRTAHPGQRLSHYDQQRGDRRVSRHEPRKRAASQLPPPQVQPPQQVQKKGGMKLDEIITPLRLGILLGCFDIIGGSLSVYMTRKRFGKAAQQQQQQAAAGGGANANPSGHPPQRHRSRRRRDDRHKKYESDSMSDDSEDEERRRRTEEHVREQLRMDYDRERPGRRGGRR